MKKYILIILILGTFFLLHACKEESPSSLKKGGNPPGQIKDVSVKNISGGAIIHYSLPSDEDLLYVKAEYEFPKGTKREVRASLYVDSLAIEGIGNTSEIEVLIYCLSRSEVSSEPIKINIQPSTPPIYIIKESLELYPDWGGFSVNYENVNKQDIVIEILKKEGNEWSTIESYYTNSSSGRFSVRGQEAIATEYALYVRDKWKNFSDTLITKLTPLYETLLDVPTPITILAGDYNQHYNGYHYGYMFDGIISAANYMGTLLTSTSILPLSFTLDFKSPTIFSRLVYWMPQGNSTIFNYASPESWEVWGSNELTNDWSKWTKIMDCKAVKPSGPGTTLTTEDREVAAKGLNFDFPSGTPSYRYLRWKTTKTFGALNAVQISELAFYGKKDE